MIEAEGSVIIERPVEDVFAYVADQTNAPRWQAGLVEVRRTTGGPIGVGTRHTAVRSFMGQMLEVGNEYVTFEPNRVVAFTGASGPLTFRASYIVEATTEGARLTSTIAIQAGGVFDDPEVLTATELRRDIDANLATLKTLLERREERDGTGPEDVQGTRTGAPS